MCLSVAEGERMIDAARRAGVVFSVFQNRRWDSDYLTLRRVLDSGILGQPYVIESAVTSFGPSPGYRNPTSDRPRGWRTYAEFGGGPMRDWGAHLFDQAVQIAGPAPLSVFADVQYRRDWDVETAGMAWLRYPPAGGARAGGGGGAALRDRDGVDLRPAQAPLVRAGLRRGLPPVRPRPPGGGAAPGGGGAPGDGRGVRPEGGALPGRGGTRGGGRAGPRGLRGVLPQRGGRDPGSSQLWRWSRRTCCTPSVSSWRRSAPRSAVPRWKAQTGDQADQGGRDLTPRYHVQERRSRGACTSCATTPGPPAPASRPAPATTCCSSPCARREGTSRWT